MVIPQELLLTPPPAGVKRPDTQGWLSLVPARTRRFGSTPPRWLWCVVASERLRCYASLDDYYQRDKAAITIHLQHAIVSQVMANLTLTLTLTLALALALALTLTRTLALTLTRTLTLTRPQLRLLVHLVDGQVGPEGPSPSKPSF